MSSDTSLADEGGDAAREDTELPTCLRQVEEAATAYLENPALSDADRRNILSTLPGNDITMDVFYAGAEGDILDPTHEAIIPRSLIWSYVMDGSNDALESIAAYFEPALDGEAKRAFIISPFDQKVDFIVVSEVHKTQCVLRFFGLRERLDPVPSWVMQILDTVGHLLRQRLPDFNYEVVRQRILPPNNISLVLLAFIRYGIYSRPYIFPSTADWNTLMDLNEIRAHCFWEYAGPEFRRRHHGQDVTKRNVLGHTGNFDMEAYEDSNHEHADEGHPNDGHAGEQLEAEKLFQLDEDSESDTSSDAGEDYANDRVNTTTVFRNFDPEPYMHAMHEIDLDKTARIKEYLERELTHDEIDEMKFDAGDENALDKLLPKNLESEKLVRENNDMKKGVEKCRERVSAVLDNLVKFMIAVGSRKNLPEDMRGWYALLLANATKEGRERIIRMLTHSSVQPLSLQYLLGQDTWAPTMFDSLAKIDLENPGEHGDLVSAYVGVGHGSDDQHFSYCGSATNTRPTSRYIGEEDRMRTHRRILALGSKEIRRRRRQAGAGGTEILLAHDKLAYSAEKGGSFFFATHRFPVHPEHSSFKKFAALALLAELINVIHLGSVSTWYTPRKSSNKAFMLISRLLMKGLRPKDLPEPVFIGTNVVLPMTQVPRAIWQLLDRSNHLRPTEKLLEDLQKVFDDRRSLSLDWADCEAVLAQNGQLSTRTNINALRKVYGDILLGKGLEYQTRFQAKHLKLTVLFTAFIRVAELQQLTYEMDGTSFGVEATKIDWISVSQEAQYIAPEGLRDIYTPEACRKLYESSKTADFREKVALFVNWERLIQGVPAKFVSAREQAQYPLPIKLRIRDICRFAVYWDMETQSYFEEKDPGSEDSRAIRLRPRTSPTVTHLVPEVIEQLKVDIGLSDGVEVKEGAWEDQTLRVSLITQLRRAFDQLRSGVSQEEVDQWKQLEELEMGWANPPVDESDLEIVLEKLHDLSTRHNILSPIRSQEILTNVDLLRKCHINPIPITRGEQRKDAGALARTEAQMNAKPKTEKPFGLLDQDGQPVRRTLFTTSCFKKPPPLSGTSKPPRDPESGTCSKCLMFTNMLSEHEPTCVGRCKGCVRARVPCAHPPGNKKCVRCERLGQRCRGNSHNDEAQPKGKQRCYKCWCFKLCLHEHLETCRGRCQACVIARVPCERTTSGKRCGTCASANQDCENFSHEKKELIHPKKGQDEDSTRPRKEAKVCPKCLCTVVLRNFKKHRNRCPGRCTECVKDRIPCERTPGYKKCKNCRGEGNKGKGDGKGNNSNNGKVCKVAPRQARLTTANCGLCGKSFANKDVCKRHEKDCTGKCSGCRLARVACIHPNSTSREPCQRCTELKREGKLDKECDGAWRRPKRKRE